MCVSVCVCVCVSMKVMFLLFMQNKVKIGSVSFERETAAQASVVNCPVHHLARLMRASSVKIKK